MKKVIEANRLSADDLNTFVRGDALALVVRGFYPDSDRVDLDSIENHDAIEEYRYVTHKDGEKHELPFGVKRLGLPFSSSFGESSDSQARQNYYDKALPQIHQLRRLFSPLLSPIDMLRLELDELWPQGAGVGRLESRLMFTGIVRITEAETDILEVRPHVDSMTPDMPIERQHAANIYLDTPSEGGELVIYPERGSLSQEQVHDIETN
ncbi:hypothetical protein N9D31_01390, partial [Oligoflexaceae bacterium]|nr:hypothetical protein [Oligoflexaceae bacterium]